MLRCEFAFRRLYSFSLDSTMYSRQALTPLFRRQPESRLCCSSGARQTWMPVFAGTTKPRPVRVKRSQRTGSQLAGALKKRALESFKSASADRSRFILSFVFS